jgi:hypothetical protein
MNNPKLHPQSGVVWVLWGFIFLLIFAVAAFAVDIGYIFVIKNRAQNAVDSAAQAGADTIYRDSLFSFENFPNLYGTSTPTPYPCDTTGLNPFKNCTPTNTAGSLTYFTMAKQEAIRMLIANGFTETPKIEVNTWNALGLVKPDNQVQISNISYTNPAVRVTMTSSAPFFFGKLLGQNIQSFTVKALAISPFPSSVNVSLPIAVGDCAVAAGWDLTRQKANQLTPGTSTVSSGNTYVFPSSPTASCLKDIYSDASGNAAPFNDIAGNAVTTSSASKTAAATSAAFTWPANAAAVTSGKGAHSAYTAATTLPSSCPGLTYAFVYTSGGAPGNGCTQKTGAWTYLASGSSGATAASQLIPNNASFKPTSITSAPPGTATCSTPSQTGGCIDVNFGAITSLYSGGSTGDIQSCINDKSCLKATLPVVTTPSAAGISGAGNYPVKGFTCITMLLSDGGLKTVFGKFDSGCSNSTISNPSASYYGSMSKPLLAE